MAVTAKIKFTQGMSDPPAGEALIGSSGVDVVVTNENNNSVETYIWEMVDAPPASTVAVGVMASGSVTSVTFTPDSPGGYLVRLTVIDLAGNKSVDIRAFQILEPSGYLIPAFEANANALNFGGQTRGWAKYLEDMLRYLLLGGGGGSVPDQYTYELTFLAAIASTDSASFTRVAGRRVTADATRYPASVTGLTKTMYFEGTIEVSDGAAVAEIKLVDTTGTVDITDSLYTTSSTAPESFSLVVPYGTASGEIRTDYIADYEVHVRLTGGSPGDVAIVTAAQLVIRYA